MRHAIALTLLTASFAGAVDAKDKTKRSADLQVLDRFAGTWDHQLTIKTPEGKTQITNADTRKWSAGGTFVIFENSVETKENPDVPEFHMMITYDPKSKTYPACFMSGPSRSILTGTWEENAQTMHWSGKDLDGNKHKGKHRFIGKDRAEASTVVTSPAGKIVVEYSWKQTRRKTTGDARHQKELKTLQGNWRFESLKEDGTDVPAKQLKKFSVVKISGTRMRMTEPDGFTDLEFKLDLNSTPALIDFITTDGDGKRSITRGIYKIDEVRLFLCVNERPGGKRPSDFDSRKGSDIISCVLRREDK